MVQSFRQMLEKANGGNMSKVPFLATQRDEGSLVPDATYRVKNGSWVLMKAVLIQIFSSVLKEGIPLAVSADKHTHIDHLVNRLMDVSFLITYGRL